MISKYLWLLSLTGTIFLTAWSQTTSAQGSILPEQVRIAGVITPSSASIRSPTFVPTTSLTKTVVISSTPTTNPVPSTSKSTPDIPAIIKQFSVGIPAGHGYGPWPLAIDAQHGRLYSFNAGRSSPDENYSISIIDLKTNWVADLIWLPGTAEFRLSSVPIDLLVDPYRPRLYALWGNRSDRSPFTSLAVIDLDTLTILDTLHNVLTVVPGPDRLYLAGPSRLWTVDPQSFQEQDSLDLSSSTSTPQSLFLLNPTVNRLYLGQNQSELAVFEATTLKQLNTYTSPAPLLQAAVDDTNGWVYVVDYDGAQIKLRVLTSDGQLRPKLLPVTLREGSDLQHSFHVAGAIPNLSVFGSEVVVTNQDQLQIFNGADLTLSQSFTIPNSPPDMVVDSITGRVYMTYYDIFSLDPATGAFHDIYTFLGLGGARADPSTNRLYALTSDGILHILSLSDYTELTRRETRVFDNPVGGRPYYGWEENRLSLDPTRHRLYIWGDRTQIIDTQTLTISATLDTPGQLTPDPVGDRLFLTPPCDCNAQQCNTLILNPDTLTGTTTLFPSDNSSKNPCIFATRLDEKNRLLYADYKNDMTGTNNDDSFFVFDISGPPRPLTSTSYLDTWSPAMKLASANDSVWYDPSADRLYAVGSSLYVFDDDLAPLAEISLPGFFKLVSVDPEAQRLYLADIDGTPPAANLLVVATKGGQLDPVPNLYAGDVFLLPQLFIAPDGTRFRFFKHQLYRSVDEDQTWQLLGQGLPNHPEELQSFTLVFSPNYAQDQTLLAGFDYQWFGGGLYRSTDGGDTWWPVADKEITHIAFSPAYTQDQTIFVSTDNDDGLFRSTDAGHTWENLTSHFDLNPYTGIVSLAISPTFAKDHLLFISADPLFRSGDGGDTWQDTGASPGLVAFSPNFARDRLVLNQEGWRSADAGQTWQPPTSELPPHQEVRNFFFSPNFATDQTVYLLLYQEYQQPLLLLRSVDAGHRWQQLQGGLPHSFDLAAATVLPNGNLYLSDPDGPLVEISPQVLTWQN